ncbi:hypothetical protein SPRG_14492 [Saprolegnia parasitica CBS 223.65]|uniref:Uncharacterized protein n=1 Tax=Saprolegnia parasitica (strain CBS 223.65) TaxID=695850 RepID=A0A067C125_SAPPC|nr:hypothetical protein SPRG_14492 [Saprolegnia parasitica CBS 223.65]KDO20246.1 hypothetical protein SPRG_14492 [Saprolegnia parasitica CBS 223.65]|eukprot:XP_012209058.1 hypothetical protein SPRG_14492 [Saprolegnia parasitica CBS 223.65]
MLETDLGATNLTDYGCPSLTAEHARYAREINAAVAHLLAALSLDHYTLTTTDAVQCGAVPITPLLMSKGYKDTWSNHRTIRIGGLMRAGLKNSDPTHRGLTKRGKMRGSSSLSQCPKAAEVLQLANGSYVKASAVPDALTVALNTNVPAYGVFHALKITAPE